MGTSAPIFNVVLGTAGHIDHGKSTLVQALTGIHPDRLKEEQERGITIDLGFAPLDLNSGLRVGIIDVPGHERFIKNMVAGASGIDFVMLVVAADDGVMAQTREHLQIVQLLGVKDGLTVITKKDLVGPDYLELVVEDIKALEAGTVLDGKPIMTVSSKTGDGIAELRGILEERLAKLVRRPSGGPFRMPIQRVFSKEGFGTVVTGVPLSGRVAQGDTLEILPPGYQGRVKGLHAYNQHIDAGQAGHSTAVNLHGPQIDKQEVVRGMCAVTPGIFRPAAIVTARMTHLPGTKWVLKHRAPVRFHSGTAEVQGKVLLLEGDQMLPATSAWVQVLLDEPVVVAPGDRFILRHQTPMVTIGGGIIVDVASKPKKRKEPAVLAELNARMQALADPKEFIAHIIASASAAKTLSDICAEAAMLPDEALKLTEELCRSKRAVALKPGALFMAPQVLDELQKAVAACVTAFLKEHPALGGIELPELRRQLEALAGAGRVAHFDEVMEILKQRGAVKIESNLVSLPGRERKLEGPLAETALALESSFQKGALAPPDPAGMDAQLKIALKQRREIMKYLLDTGKLLDAGGDVYFHRDAYEKAKSELQKLFAQRAELTTSEIRQHLGMTRKFAVPLVELFDKKGFTVRLGDKRKLK